MNNNQLNHNNLRSGFKWNLIGLLGKLLIDLIFITIRIKIIGRENVEEIFKTKKYLFSLWHSRILPLAYAHKGIGSAVMVSRSKDGELIAQVIHRQGHFSLRGSSKKSGKKTLNELYKEIVKNNRPGTLTPDGPQGPPFIVKPGIINLASLTGYPIIPVSASARKIKVFGSWDGFILPWPFTECIIKYGRPLKIPEIEKQEILEEYRQELENEMNKITRELDSHFGHDLYNEINKRNI